MSWIESGASGAQILRIGLAARGLPRTEGVYVNFLGGDEGPDRVREAYGDPVYDRLEKVKTTYDPDNVFHHNQNIRPGPSGSAPRA